MKIDGPFYATLDTAIETAKQMADIGYDGVYTLEGSNDPFFPLVLASEHAPSLDIATGIAVAFPRNPMHLAYQAWDLQKHSKGKFLLGIGSQVKAHIENRFGVGFAPPAKRMREYILAMKAIFNCFQHGEKLKFEGEFFRHTLMTPMFNPGPNPYGPPPILLGALGPVMTQVAGEVADGLIIHPFNSEPFVREHALPAVDKGLEKSGRSRGDFILSIAAMIITGQTEEHFKNAYDSVKNLLAFYGSTPAYRPPMDACGFGELQPELNRLSKEGKWDQMATLIDDKFVRAFAVVGEPHEIAPQLTQKYGDEANRLSIYAPYYAEPDVWRQIITDLKITPDV